jgi:hypothetical protein
MRELWASDVVKAWGGATTQAATPDLQTNAPSPVPAGPKAGPAPTNPTAAPGAGSGGAAQGGPAPGGPGDLMRMRKDKSTPNLTLSDDDLRAIVGDGPDVVKRDKVEDALKKFLEDLGKAQKHQDHVVTSTDKVWVADATLHAGLTDDAKGTYTPIGGDGQAYQAADLAHKIAQQLPDTIPGANYRKFLKLVPKDTPVGPGTITDQIRRKYEEERDKIISKLPEKVRKLAKKGMDAAIEHGLPYAADAAMKAAGVPSDVEDAMKKVVEDFAKKVTGDKDKENK